MWNPYDCVVKELGKETITYGDVEEKVDESGYKLEVPLETELTDKLEYNSKMGLDYIVHFEDKDENSDGPSEETKSINYVKGSTRVEKFIVKDMIHLQKD